MLSHTILVVDDSAVLVEAIKTALIQDGYQVDTAYDGIQALDIIRKKRFDLILLDIDMPRMNGYQLCKLIKSDEKLKNIPVIMLTSKTSEADRIWGLKAGSDEYITKPFDYSKVKNAIIKLLKSEIQ